MSSYVEIANLALDMLGKENISSLDEFSNQASKLNNVKLQVQNSILEAYAWRWARDYAALAAVTNTKRAAIWPYAYAKPGNCRRLIRVVPTIEVGQSDTIPNPFEYTGGIIYSGVSGAWAEFVCDQSDPTIFPAAFVDAYAAAWAARVCMALTKNVKLWSEMLQLSRNMFIIACTADANQGNDSSDADSETIAARNT